MAAHDGSGVFLAAAVAAESLPALAAVVLATKEIKGSHATVAQSLVLRPCPRGFERTGSSRKGMASGHAHL